AARRGWPTSTNAWSVRQIGAHLGRRRAVLGRLIDGHGVERRGGRGSGRPNAWASLCTLSGYGSCRISNQARAVWRVTTVPFDSSQRRGLWAGRPLWQVGSAAAVLAAAAS